MSGLRRSNPTDTDPQPGDTYVILETDVEPLVERMNILGLGFLKAVQGSMLRQVIKADFIGGCLEFIVGGGPSVRGPKGTLTAKLNEVTEETAGKLTAKTEHCTPAKTQEVRRRLQMTDVPSTV